MAKIERDGKKTAFFAFFHEQKKSKLKIVSICSVQTLVVIEFELLSANYFLLLNQKW